MKKIDVDFALGSFFNDFKHFIEQRKKIREQRTFCWCPVCKEDLCSNNSFVSDEIVVLYDCKNCETLSAWDFDMFPAPVLKWFQLTSGKERQLDAYYSEKFPPLYPVRN